MWGKAMETITQDEIDAFTESVKKLYGELEKKVARIGNTILAAKGSEELPIDIGNLSDELASLSYKCDKGVAYIASLCNFAQKSEEG